MEALVRVTPARVHDVVSQDPSRLAHTRWHAASHEAMKREGKKKKKKHSLGSNTHTWGIDDALARPKKRPRSSDAAAASDSSAARVKNALRSAQLDKRELLLWRKFGYGPSLFRQYYRAQDLMDGDDELEEVEACYSTALPITFRLHATDGRRASSLKARLRQLRDANLVHGLEWMPADEGWQATAETGDAGRREKLHEAVAEVVDAGTSSGLLARQEAVSMLPVLVLAPHLKPGDRVLDVCAAPGNKTMQLLERVSPPEDGDERGGVRGLVVANDAHPGRVKTLQDAIKRHVRSTREMESLVITCSYGQDVPVPIFDDGIEGYDAVLADVPCSGDGTFRKDPDALRRWHPGGGNALHATQVAVARRMAQLVKPGGHLLYSTCSLNPVEDEAVVAAILKENPEFELVKGAMDAGAPGMRYRPGVSTWKVAEHAFKGQAGTSRFDSDSESESDDDVTLRWYDDYGTATAAGMPATEVSMWPPSQEVAKRMHLERCARLLPHDQDTGGFFIALLRRKAKKKITEGVSDASQKGECARTAAARAAGDLPDPVRPLPPNEMSAIAAQLGLGSSSKKRLWLGAGGAVTLSPRSVSNLTDLGPIAIASAGVVALIPRASVWNEASDAAFPYDLTSAGAEALARASRKRRVQVVPSDLQVMLAARSSGADDPSNTKELVCLTAEEMSEATRRKWRACVDDRQTGAVILVLVKRGKAEGDPPMVVFSAAGRCSEDGLMLSPEVTAAEASRLLKDLSRVAGTKRNK